ncbi:BTB/POZ protein [Pyronema omphalodes]|nr:BTB/POZ protein [Pyronema omphalodes]
MDTSDEEEMQDYEEEMDNPRFLSNFKTLLNSDLHSDLTIKVGNSTFKAHKAILAVRTQFLTMATQEHGFIESQDNTVTLEDQSAHAVWRFLAYCYTGNYEESQNKDIEGDDDGVYLMHTRVHALADMFGVPQLKVLAAQKLKRQFEEWAPDDFIECVKETYTTTYHKDRKIRNVLVDAAYNHSDELIKHEKFCKETETLGEFLMALVSKFATEESCGISHPVPKCRRCGYKEVAGFYRFSRSWTCNYC